MAAAPSTMPTIGPGFFHQGTPPPFFFFLSSSLAEVFAATVLGSGFGLAVWTGLGAGAGADVGGGVAAANAVVGGGAVGGAALVNFTSSRLEPATRTGMGGTF